MKKGYLLLGFYLFFGVLSAQPSIQWHKTYGGSSFDEAQSIKQTSDGGYIVAGSTASSNGDVFGQHGGDDFWLLKLNSTGAIQWKKNLGGTGNDVPYTVLLTPDGGYFVAGYSASNNYDVSGNHGGFYDGWVAKLSSSGAIQWQKALGGTGQDQFWSAQLTADNGYILTGRADSNNGDLTENKGLKDVWVVKLNTSGAIEWQKSFGGSSDDLGYSGKQTPDGGYIIVGQTASNDGDVTGLYGNVDFWVLKLSSTGQLEWQKTLGGIAGDIPNDVLPCPDGGYVVVGFIGGSEGDITEYKGLFDYWIFKLDNQGELQWQKSVGGSGLEWARQAVQTDDGGYVIAGSSGSNDGDVIGNNGGEDVWLVKINAVGELVWQQTYGGTKADNGFCITRTDDNGFAVAGYAWSTDGDLAGSTIKGYNDFLILKLSPESTPTHEAPFAAMQLFPNPTTEAVTLKVPMEVNSLNVTITDAQGRAVSQQTIDNGGTLNVKRLPPGIYQLAAKAGDRTTYFGKIEKL